MINDALTPATYRRLTRALLDAQAPPSAWFESANRLHELLSLAAGLADPSADAASSEETQLASGKALSPVDAGRCLVDLARTRAFLQGLSAAVAELRRQRPLRPVHVLYAGCGPFATLTLPLTTRFGPEALRLTLLDVHEASVHGVASIVRTLGLEAHVAALLRADATVFEVPPEPAVDILLVETMQRALTREPQVAITRHLLPQLPAEALLLPASITLRACLAHIGAEVSPETRARDRVELGTVFELSAETARSGEPPVAGRLQAGTVRLPRAPHPGEDLVIATCVRAYDDFVLGDYASGITFPEIVADAPALAAGTQVGFAYRLDPPGLEVRQSSSPHRTQAAQ